MRQIIVILLLLLVWSCGFANKLFTDPTAAEPSVEVTAANDAVDQVQVQQAPPMQAQYPASAPAPAAQTSAPAAQTPAAVATMAAAAPSPQPAYVQNVPVAEDESMDRVARRKLKAQRFAAGIDSLVTSHSFRFLPNSMQELPGGWTQLIYNELYFVGVFKDHVELHMPTIRGGVVQYYEILNFDTFEVRNYQASKVQFGWNVSFNLMANNDSVYTINMLINTLTGETVLNLLTLSNTVRYVGYIQSISKN